MRILWNDGWKFALLPLNSTRRDLDGAALRPVLLPHDWLIENTEDLYASGDGWYLKTFLAEELPQEEIALLDFDGVYMDADVLLNGELIRSHTYGYTSFFADLTGKIRPGRNEIAVHIRHRSPNSRWYSGAGIFRDVHLIALPARYMVPDGFQVNTRRAGGAWQLAIQAEIRGPGDEMPRVRLQNSVGGVLAEGTMAACPGGAEICLTVEGVTPWSVERPCLYSLTCTLGAQKETMRVGFRETAFTPDKGFFLNGAPVKLHGVCLHHDLGALGAAYQQSAARRQLAVMCKMGVNAIRTSHNPPARRFLDLCDEMGFLVIDEMYDMWELAKTPFDNARFFPKTYPEDVASWVRRDRCHPSVILWSIGNEIYDMQASDRGQMWTRTLMDEVHRHDTRHAHVTFGSNYMPWEGAQKCAEIVKLPGYNYAEKLYAQHHEQHPGWVIYGSETASLLASRGIYHFPMKEDILSEEDLQCSALLNSNTSWGAKDLPKMLSDDLNTPYSLGQFIWSGIDYIGEPTPYHTRSCYFGQTDTACLPKDAYYFYQAMWTDTPMIHIGVYWDWNEGQLIDVPVMTNGASAELFLNGVSLGKKAVDRLDAKAALPVWQVPYAPGELLARAYDGHGNILCETARRSFGDAQALALRAENGPTIEKGEIAFLIVSALDHAGRPVENAVDRVHAFIDGPGVLLGMDNGDSTDRDGYQVFSRRLFSGKLLLMVGAQEEGEIRVRVTGEGLRAAEVSLRVLAGKAPCACRAFPALCKERKAENDIFTRRIDLKALSSTVLTPERPAVSFRVSCLPENAAPQELRFRITNAQGVDMPCASIEQSGDLVTVTARGDGSMYLRAAVCNGYPHPRVLSVVEITAAGFGPMGLDPYRFIAAALYDRSEGEIGAGNEKGVAFARDGESAVGFSFVDFGPVGSDEITLPVFALNDDLYHIRLWDGMPGEGGVLIAALPYQKKSVWNVYQPETYRLPYALRGVHTIAFSMHEKIHLKGFSFARQSRALRDNRAMDADQLYGDSFVKEADAVKKIGNNVTLRFENMAFDGSGEMLLILDGETPLPVNQISLRVTGENGETATSACGFVQGGRGEQAFRVPVLQGLCTVDFVFLPGSNFDFYGFRFSPLPKD